MCEFFTGLPGSGKTTELARLARRLEGKGFLPVLIRGHEWLQTTAPIELPDLWTVIVWQVEGAVLALEGKDPKEFLQDGYLTRFRNWLTRTEVGASKLNFGATDPGSATKTNLIVEFRDNPTLREQMRLNVRQRLSTFLDEARAELVSFEVRAKAAGRARGIVVIFDSLERLRGSSANWREVLDSAEALFASGAHYVRLPVHAVYTVPPALVTLRTMRGLHFLPMIKLQTREGAEWAEGFEAARSLVEHRVPRPYLNELFGAPSCEMRLKEVIRWSGGYPRELLRLLQNLLIEERIDDSAMRRVWNDLVQEYRLRIPSEAFPWLARVGVERYSTLENDEQRRLAEGLILDNAVLHYANDSGWFDLHPAVREIPGVQAEMAKLTP